MADEIFRSCGNSEGLRTLFNALRDAVEEFTASTTWNPGSIASGAAEDKDVTVTGAALGDFVQVSFDEDVTGLSLTASVTAADTVTATLANNTGGAVDLGEGTLRVRVASHDAATGDLVEN